MSTFTSALFALLFWTAWGTCAALLGGHFLFDDATVPTVVLHALAGYLWILAAGVVVLAAASEGWTRTALSAPLLIVALAIIAPGHVDRTAPGDGRLRLVTANVLMVHHDPERLIDDLIATDPDIIVLQEVDPRWAAILGRTSELDAWEYRHIDPEEGSFGVAMFSRVPATLTTEDLQGIKLGRMDLEVDGRPLTIYDVHTLPPRGDRYAQVWTEQMADLALRAQHSDTPVVFAGDFNATRHHPSYRRLLRSGLRDAHAIAGRSSAKTWPNGLFPAPSLRLDHVLVGDGVRVHGVSETAPNGSDHLPIVVDLSLGESAASGLLSATSGRTGVSTAASLSVPVSDSPVPSRGS